MGLEGRCWQVHMSTNSKHQSPQLHPHAYDAAIVTSTPARTVYSVNKAKIGLR